MPTIRPCKRCKRPTDRPINDCLEVLCVECASLALSRRARIALETAEAENESRNYAGALVRNYDALRDHGTSLNTLRTIPYRFEGNIRAPGT
jgi:hypothetical protein